MKGRPLVAGRRVILRACSHARPVDCREYEGIREQERGVEGTFDPGIDLDSPTPQEEQCDAVVLPRVVPGAPREIERHHRGAEGDVIDPHSVCDRDCQRGIHREESILAPVRALLIDTQQRRTVVRAA